MKHFKEKEEVKDKKKKTKSQGNQSSRGDHVSRSQSFIFVEVHHENFFSLIGKMELLFFTPVKIHTSFQDHY